MIVNNENNRTNLEVSVEEALEMIRELSTAVSLAIQNGHRTTNGMPASERLTDKNLPMQDQKFKPSSFNVTVRKD